MTDAWNCVPDFGAVITRHRAVAIYRSHQPSLTLLCAPAGYGKSVLAAQLVRYGDFDEVLWVSGLDADMRSERLFVSVLAGLAPPAVDDNSTASDPIAGPIPKDDAVLAVAECLKEKLGTRLCVVIDGCNLLDDLSPFDDFAALLRSLTSPASSLIVTCRRVASGQMADPARVLTLEEADLRFTEDEIGQLQALIGDRPEQHQLPSRLRQRFGGHPALTSLMLRHIDLDAELTPPRDLVWYVERLVAAMPAETLKLAFVASLLAEDSVRAIVDCTEYGSAKVVAVELQSLSPLLVIAQSSAPESRSFRAHAVLREAVRERASTQLSKATLALARDKVLHRLQAVGAYARMRSVLDTCPEDEVVKWCQTCGNLILRFSGADAIVDLLERIGPSALAASSSLLLLRATALRDLERFDEACTAATLAAQLAETQEDQPLWLTSMLLVARLALDRSQFGVARRTLAAVEYSGALTDSSTARLLNAYMAVIESHEGKVQSAVVRAGEVARTLDGIGDLGSSEAALVLNCMAGVEGLSVGHWSVAARYLAAIADRKDLSPCHRITLQANLANCQVELGCLDDASRRLDTVIDQCEAAGLRQLASCAYGTRAALRCACDDHQGEQADWAISESLAGSSGDELSLLSVLIGLATCQLAEGTYSAALATCERAMLLSEAMNHGVVLYSTLIRLGMAASMLGVGDVWGAKREAGQVRDAIPAVADGQRLRADLILAEVCRLEGDDQAAVGHLSQHAEYVSTGSANWLTAMSVRAFPGLLGILVRALGAGELPLRMLRMIPPATLDKALERQSCATASDAEILRARIGFPVQAAADCGGNPHPCHVRVFGGLEVTTPSGTVEEEDWRKRKARLLFLTLVLRQRQDIPRDVLLERLWPDMDEEHARRNFYVTWSTMKRALSCTDTPSDAKALVQCSGGVCRVTRLVRSDLDDFDDALSALRSAAAKNDVAGVKEAATQLTVIYRGELLPGDLYEEWFAEVRERAKHDFCDAMVTAATVVSAAGLSDDALMFLRKASAADPWREDVYQSMMRCQMGSGQRSRAIETYLMCRSRLTEDLGIDPSVETTRLYQAVLAMDASPDEVDFQNV